MVLPMSFKKIKVTTKPEPTKGRNDGKETSGGNDGKDPNHKSQQKRKSKDGNGNLVQNTA